MERGFLVKLTARRGLSVPFVVYLRLLLQDGDLVTLGSVLVRGYSFAIIRLFLFESDVDGKVGSYLNILFRLMKPFFNVS